MMDITSLDLIDTIKALEEKQFTVEELNRAYLERVEKYNPELNAFITVNEESNEIPAAIKDVFCTEGLQTTAGSKILEGFKPPYNATVVERLLTEDISIIGKLNCDEFAMGSSGENSGFGATHNPWDKTKVSGGSSSGSVAAVAADLCVFSLGTDTGGSIRQPASLSGVVGFKPSYGRVSRYGVIPMASSLDCPGPVTKSVRDAKLVLSWIQGPDGYDANVASEFKVQSPKFKVEGLRIGIPKEYFGEGLDPEVGRVVKEAIKKLEELGAQVVSVELPHTEYAIAAYYILMASEVSSNLARFDGIRFGYDRSKFGEEVKRRIMLGTFSLSTGYYEDYFNKAAKVRSLIRKDFEEAFKKCDVIVGPVSPTTAWNIGEKVDDPLKMYLSDIYTVPGSLAGIPGTSVPCGFVHGLPVGLQILGPYMKDELVLDVAEAYESSAEWYLKKPELRI